MGIIRVESIENRDFYSCTALNTALDLVKKGELEPDDARRFDEEPGCLLVDQANKNVAKRRHDI